MSEIKSMIEEKIAKRTFIPSEFRPYIIGSAIEIEKKQLNENELKIQNDDRNEYIDLNQNVSELTLLAGSFDPIVISSKNDNTMNEFIHYFLQKEKKIIPLYLEDLGTKWDFCFAEDVFSIIINKRMHISPKAIYSRICDADYTTELGQKIQLLNEAIQWIPNFIGQEIDNSFNWSKPYQQICTLQQVIDKSEISSIKTPKTIIVKNKQIPKDYFDHSIIKSISSTRSIVVDESTYENWDKNNLNSIPIMLQERIDGKDLRFHVLNYETFWPMTAINKKTVDYRYGCTEKDLKEYSAPNEIINFSISLSKHENNNLVGIDFIQQNENFFCLESNPGPGWNWFDKGVTSHERSIKECLYQTLIK